MRSANSRFFLVAGILTLAIYTFFYRSDPQSFRSARPNTITTVSPVSSHVADLDSSDESNFSPSPPVFISDDSSQAAHDGEIASTSTTENSVTLSPQAIPGSPSLSHSQSELWQDLTFASRKIIIAKMQEEDTNWVQDELEDLLEADGQLSTAIYTVDDPTAELRPPINKGHEAMVYLTYLIDFYDKLPDISVFLHSHSGTWHNNNLLNLSSSAMVRYMNTQRVLRDGYVNLRCHWEPGCPDWLHPGVKELDVNKQEEVLLLAAWKELFPWEPVPDTLAQPCCSQFAVSAQAIRKNPRQRYVDIRDWLIKTDIDDHDSGRIFEYCWQVLFNGSPSYCPNPRICYCDGYGVCFDTHKSFDDYFQVERLHGALQDELDAWREQLEKFKAQQKSGWTPEEELASEPEIGRDWYLEQRLEETDKEMTRRKTEALALGQDPHQRAMLLDMSYRQVSEVDQKKLYDWRSLEPIPML